MQVSFNRYSASKSAEISSKLTEEDFGAKLKLNVINDDEQLLLNEKPQNQEDEEEKEVFLDVVDDVVIDGDDDDDDDFTFVCMNPDGSPSSADDIFQNGQIRPIFPLFNRDLLLSDDYDGKMNNKNTKPLRPPLKKLFVEDQDDSTSSTEHDDEEPAGPYCEWSRKTVQDASPDSCKKSNSTGFSKLWRFRELLLRSNSDGKDAFVFLNPNNEKSEKNKNEKVKVVAGPGPGPHKVKAKEETASLSAYMKKSRAKEEGEKRKPYLPYKQAGFFTNVNGLSRNIHPF